MAEKEELIQKSLKFTPDEWAIIQKCLEIRGALAGIKEIGFKHYIMSVATTEIEKGVEHFQKTLEALEAIEIQGEETND